MPRHTALAFAAAMLWSAATYPAAARDLTVGATRVLKLPSQAATMAMAGDTIRIDPGTYADCAVWHASHLVIEAAAPGVRLVDKVCADKGIFVVTGDDVTVRGISFEGAKASWHNGAGIRGLGENLTVEDSRFVNNEDGILTAGSPASIVRVTGSTFIGNGACIGQCAHGIYAGTAIALLQIEHSTFLGQHVGHHIKSRAHNTVVEDSRIEDGPTGNSSYLIDVPNGGNVLIQGNEMEKGPNSENRGVAISIGVEGVTNWTDVLIIRNNRFRNDMGRRTTFVRNSTLTPAEVTNNTLTGPVTPLRGKGGIPLEGR
ncbi:MAG TPA: right-handed parallel beta-helix repeat-containing protein [Rhodopila sp.]|nr:right-handed parallel beta-helix repeat-containing protein [Rhodopila sp.]